MGKTYDIGKNSDMKRFMRDLEKGVMDKAKRAVQQKNYDIDCPHCGKEINVPTGKSQCPYCKGEIDLTLDIHF